VVICDTDIPRRSTKSWWRPYNFRRDDFNLTKMNPWFSTSLSWRSVLLVEETGGSGENHRPAASHWQTLSRNVVLSTPRLSGFRTHNPSQFYGVLGIRIQNPLNWFNLNILTQYLKVYFKTSITEGPSWSGPYGYNLFCFFYVWFVFKMIPKTENVINLWKIIIQYCYEEKV
jgi:hypothetical protein